MRKEYSIFIVTFIVFLIYGYCHCSQVGFVSATTKCDVGGVVNIIYAYAGERNGCSDGVSGPDETLCAVDARDDENINVIIQVGHSIYDAFLDVNFTFEDSKKRYFKFQAFSTPDNYNAQLNGVEILPENFILNASTSDIKVYVPAGQNSQLQWELSITSTISADEILKFFNESVSDGSLEGYGPGKSANNRLNAFRKMLERARDLINNNRIKAACQEFKTIYKKCDSMNRPSDFIIGTAVPELNDMIANLMAELGCE